MAYIVPMRHRTRGTLMMEIHDFSQTITTTSPPPSTRMSPWISRALKLVLGWSERYRQRCHLAALDEAALRDIGLTHRDVQREISKPFWRL